jgi:hypothetical protein
VAGGGEWTACRIGLTFSRNNGGKSFCRTTLLQDLELQQKLHNTDLNDLYCSPNIVRVVKSRRIRWAGHVARMGIKERLYRVLVGKPEGKRQLGRPWCR